MARPWPGHLQGWPTTSRPPEGVASHGQAPTGATGCSQGPLQGQPLAARADYSVAPIGTIAHGQGGRQRRTALVGQIATCDDVASSQEQPIKGNDDHPWARVAVAYAGAATTTEGWGGFRVF
ncbi:hypothetical protein GW17_00058231 [Ensete ventricosum]|nr:hypothetical protein GW17_00058231 [Ensete ventricosum]